MYGMGVFTTEGGVLCECGTNKKSQPSLFGDFQTFCGPAYFITRANILSGVRIFYHACGYQYDLMLCEKTVLMFQKVN